jgi:hypothetical protein
MGSQIQTVRRMSRGFRDGGSFYESEDVAECED